MQITTKLIFISFCLINFCEHVTAQVYRHSNALLFVLRNDSTQIKYQSKKAWVEINRQTGELVFRIKLNTFYGNDDLPGKNLQEHHAKIYFRGNLGVEVNNIISNRMYNTTHNITGYVKANGISHPVMAGVSFFQTGNQNDSEEKILMTLTIPFNLKDFKMDEYFPEILNETTIMLVNQPVNFTAW